MVVVLSMSLSSCYFLPKEEEVLAPPPSLKKPEKNTYNVLKVGRGDIEKNIRSIANVVSVQKVSVSFDYRAGYVKRIYKNIGDKVKKGDVLAELDTDDIVNNIEEQQLVLNNLKAKYNQLIDSEGVNVKLEQLELDNLKDEYENMISIKSVYAKADIKEKEQSIKKQEINLIKTKNEYQNSIIDAKQQLDMAQLKIDQLNLELSKSKLIAPVDGEVNYICDINEGEYVGVRKEFMQISDLDRLQWESTENQTSFFVKGMEIEAEIDGNTYKGTVIMTPNEIPCDELNNSTQMGNKIRYKIDGVKNMKEGQTAHIKVVLDRKENVIVIPKSVVHVYDNKHFVKILEDGLVSDRDIEIGISSITEYEVLDGLKEGELILK